MSATPGQMPAARLEKSNGAMGRED